MCAHTTLLQLLSRVGKFSKAPRIEFIVDHLSATRLRLWGCTRLQDTIANGSLLQRPSPPVVYTEAISRMHIICYSCLLRYHICIPDVIARCVANWCSRSYQARLTDPISFSSTIQWACCPSLQPPNSLDTYSFMLWIIGCCRLLLPTTITLAEGITEGVRRPHQCLHQPPLLLLSLYLLANRKPSSNHEDRGPPKKKGHIQQIPTPRNIVRTLHIENALDVPSQSPR